MRVKVIGKFRKEKKQMEKLVKQAGLELSQKPKVIITYGGDGTYLIAERNYPGIPKLLLRENKSCNTCFSINPKKALAKLRDKKFRIKKYSKIEATIGKKKVIATNDIAIINTYPNHALRFEVRINKKTYKNLIGDGVVISTPFGSSAYFKSITRKTFTTGIGVAFNNLTELLKHIVTNEKNIITVTVTRGSAWLACDNDKKLHKIKPGKKVTIKASKKKANIILP